MGEAKKDIGRFFKHSYIYAIGNIINRIGAFILLPVYTNYLTIEEYGSLELFYAVSSVVFGFLSMGLAHATLRFYFEYDKDKDKHAVVSTNYIAAFVLSIVGVSIFGVWYEEISLLIFNSTEYKYAVIIILGTIVFELSSQICLAYIRAIERSMLFVYISIAKLMIQVLLNIYLVIYAEEGVVGILFGNFMAVFIGWIILSSVTLKGCGVSFHYKKLVKILLYSFPFLLATFTELISANVDKFGLNYLDTIGAVGIYMLAIKFSMIIEQLIGEPFNRSYGSFRFSIMKNDNAALIQANIVRYLFYATIFIALGISLFIKDLLIIMSEQSFWKAADIVPLVMLASILKIMNYPIQTGVLYAKKTKYFFYIGILMAIISTIGNLSLIPMYGILGACFALIITNAVSLVVMHKMSQKYFYVMYDYKKMFGAFILAVLFYLTSIPFLSEILYFSVLIKTTLIIIYIYIFFNFFNFLTFNERKYCLTFINKKILKRIK